LLRYISYVLLLVGPFCAMFEDSYLIQRDV